MGLIFSSRKPSKPPARFATPLITPPLLPPDFDPNANRDAYWKAFEEIRQRASEQAQKNVEEENEDEGSSSFDADNHATSTDQEVTNSPAATETANKERLGNVQSNSGDKKRCSPPKQLSRSLHIGSSKKQNTLHDITVMSETNNSIVINEILEDFLGNVGKGAHSNIENGNASLDQPRQSVFNAVSPLERESPFSNYNVQEQVVNENFAFLDHTQNGAMGSSTYQKGQLFIIERSDKDIKSKNTSTTPFEFLTGSYRKTFVTIKRCRARCDAAARLVEEASERDVEILSRVHHPSIVILMALICPNTLINHMTLVLESVDCTLNNYLYHKKKSFTNIESIMIVEQIGSAALYLHECGFVHSNICSHNILLRERPWLVKLSSFELATDIEFSAIKAQIEKSSYPANSNINPKYFIYDKIHRSDFSMHNYQAPELLRADKRFVFPTPKADVYSLCLLLWELCNRTVPFDTHSKLDMELIIATGNLNIKFPDRQRCHFFMDVFEAALVVEPEERSLDMPNLVDMLLNIELKILDIGENNTGSSADGSSADGSSADGSSTDVSFTYFEVDIEDTFGDPIPVEEVLLNSNQFEFDGSVLSPCLLASEYKSDYFKKEKKRKQLQWMNQRVGELSPFVKESTKHIYTNLDKHSHTRHQPENVLESPEKQKVTSNQQRPIPPVVGFSVTRNDSKSYGNILDAPDTNASKTLNEEFPSISSRIQFFNSIIKSLKPVDSPPKGCQLRTNVWCNRQTVTANSKSGDINLGHKRELSMCNQFVNSNDDAMMRFSLRETIEKFEKRGPIEYATKINVTTHQATASNNSGSKNSCHKLSWNVGASNKCQMSGKTN